jgi:hypothetical protein
MRQKEMLKEQTSQRKATRNKDFWTIDFTSTLVIKWPKIVCVADSNFGLRIILTCLCALHAESFFIAAEYDTNLSN